MLGLFSLSVVLFLWGCSASDGDPVVETPLGKVRGYYMTSRSGQAFMAFSGLPYAKPPVGSLRFQSPEPAPAWPGIKEAKEDGPYCIQYVPGAVLPVQGVEDCLYLAVYTKNITGKAPVLVHFHGGAFITGNAKPAQPHYLMDEDIVVVTVNYRLGIFGFLSFESPEMPGNQGMKDQVMSLRWVQQNIASFGGDPNKVTIIGESAGGASVTHHIVSPLSRGFFHAAMAESGCSYGPWTVGPPGFGRSKAEKLMKLLGCPNNPQEGISCIMEKDYQEIISKFPDFLEWQTDPMQTFGPVFESAGPNSFLVGPISEWEPSPVPLLMGVTSGEAQFRTLMMLTDPNAFNYFVDNFDRLAPMSMIYAPTASNPDEVTKEIRKFYFSSKEKISLEDFNNLTMVYSDIWFVIPALEEANKHNGKVYFYYNDYVPDTPTQQTDPFKQYTTGANHGSEGGYIWNYTRADTPLDDAGLKLSKSLIKSIVNLMKNGIPNIPGSDLEWKTWTPEDHTYVYFDTKGFRLEQGLAEDRFKFWKSVNYRDNYEKLITKQE